MNPAKMLIVLSSALLLAAPFTGYTHHNPSASGAAAAAEQSLPSFTQIAKKSMPATVFIKSTFTPQPFSGSDQQSPFDPFGDDFFRHFFNMPNGRRFQQIPQQPQIAGGSGFFVSADGYIVTNYHVVKDASQITIVLNDGREFPATVSGTDPKTDLALVKINETGLPYLTFGDSDGLEIGEWVITIGSPFALESSLTVGVVSAKGRDLGISPLEDFIQTDAVINPGNSGGPLINLQGQVIGVNTAILSHTGEYAGIGFSIPSHIVQHVIDQIMNKGDVRRAYLGVILQPVDKELADAIGLEKTDGALISDVMKDSPAAKGGLQQGDVILQYNDKAVKSMSKFRNEIAMMDPGQTINLKVLRNGKTMNLNLVLGSQSEATAAAGELAKKIGIEVDNVSQEFASRFNYPSDAPGVVITTIQSGSPAQMAGLKPGFLITGVAMYGNEPKAVRNTSDFEEALKDVQKRKHVILIVRHQNFQRYYTVKIG